MIATLLVISLFGGFLSGLLGLGGAIIMIPLMLTVPPMFNVGELTMKEVAALSMVQVLAASISGILIHRKNQCVNFKAVLLVGIPMGACSFVGSYLSKHMPNKTVMIIFGSLTIISLILLLLKKEKSDDDPTKEAAPDPNPVLSILIGACVGTLAGIVGAGGGFVMLPLLMVVLKMPVKLAVGTSLGVVFIGAFFGALGKILSMQVDFVLLIPVILGSAVASRVGALVSKKTPSKVIRYILLLIVVFSMIQVWVKIFTDDPEKVSGTESPVPPAAEQSLPTPSPGVMEEAQPSP